MNPPPNRRAPRQESPRDGAGRRIGRPSEFVGSRLVILGMVAGAVGLGFLGYAGFEVWRLITQDAVASRIIAMVMAGFVAFALMSIGGSLTRTGLRYLRGERTMSGDIGRFVARRMERRRLRRR